MVLMMDANEDVTDGAMCKQLRNADIGLQEAVHAAVDGKGPHTYFRGSDPIDGMWTTPEVEVTSAAYLPFDPELGDHRPVIANISKRSLVGDNGPRVQRVTCRRLNSKVERIRQEYIDRLEEQMRNHNVLDRLQRLEPEEEGELGELAKKALLRLDKVITELMMGAEKKCHKLYRGAYEFSPQVKKWIDQGRAIQALIRFRKTDTGNRANIK